jgi:hypothetical protein
MKNRPAGRFFRLVRFDETEEKNLAVQKNQPLCSGFILGSQIGLLRYPPLGPWNHNSQENLEIIYGAP